MKKINKNGFSLIELTISMALMGILGVVAFAFYNKSQRDTRIAMDDVQTIISRFGASKLMTRDLSGTQPSFNFLNIPDENNLPFYALPRNELCRSNCGRKLTLTIPAGKTKSASFYLITSKSVGKETAKFNIHPNSVFTGSTYTSLNKNYANPDLTITRSLDRPESPWIKGRLLMLTSEIEFFDCFSSTHSLVENPACTLSCFPSGTCNHVAKRPFRFLGIVNQNERDMTFYPVQNKPDLLKNRYKICRPDSELKCIDYINVSSGILNSRTFFEKLPYVPGLDNQAFLTPVELISYHLERGTPGSPDHEINLVRTTATLVGTQLVFDKKMVLMSGVQSLVFSRENISNPTIEYKFRKVRLQKSIK